ncbi:MAG TPA: aminopeptidase [bacterium]|nr:aminopeptidase [bacterium]
MRRALPLLLALSFCGGCFSMRYLAQAANGERKMLAAARPIPKVVADPKTDPRIRDLLARVAEIRAFGESQGLKSTKNYGRYADLHRDAAVWVVEACAPLSFTPKRWHFPIAGSVPYLGFFHEKDARRFAADLAAKESLDVDVRTAGAFSTLGWFKDPILSTMIPPGDEAAGELADVVLHESTHATLYVKDQSAFDESLASFVADRLTPQWLEMMYGPESKPLVSWKTLQDRWRTHVDRFHRAWEELDAVYRSPRSDEDKRAEKARILKSLATETGTREPINNATLMDYRTYDTGGTVFEELLGECGGDWKKFFDALRGLKPQDFPRSQADDFADAVRRIAPRCHS